jgi:Cu(I)/Ag(I) efflux system membrane fusion protein
MFATVSLKTPLLETEPFRSQLAAFRERLASTGTARPVADGASIAPNAPKPTSDEALITAQKFCPVTGAKLGSMGQPVRATASKQPVMLCCAGCEDKLAESPDYYLRRLSTVSEDGVLAVPEQAIIDTGNMKIAYVERQPGLFEGVAVTLGPLSDGYYPVIDGLLPGDRIAAAGSFLIDAETRLNPAAASAYFGASGTPSSGGSPAPPSATRATGPTTGTLSEKDRANLAKLAAPDRKLAEQQRMCPISNEPLGSMGVPVKMDVRGTPLFLCCEGCRDEVAKDPQAALTKIRKRAK